MLRKYIPILVTAVVLLVAAGSIAYAQIGGGVGWFDIIQDVRVSGKMEIKGTNGLTVENLNVNDDIMVDSSVSITDDLTVTDDATFSDNVLFDNHVALTKQTRIVVTDGSVIAPLGMYAPISSTAATGTSAIATPTSSGSRLLIIHNVGSQTITLTDTGILHLTGNGTLTSDDSTILIWDGAAWNQVAAESAN